MNKITGKKLTFYNELAYLIGVVIMAIGTALMAFADLGVSMVVAPAYILHLKISEYLPFFTFGVAEYCLQAILLITMCLILRKFKFSYLFSIVTTVIYSISLDVSTIFVEKLPIGSFAFKLLYFAIGFIIVAYGISLLFHSYVSPAAYELFVKEISAKRGMNINKFKMIYDISSCLVAITLSFVFFGLFQFKGIMWGTIVCAVINAPAIALCSKINDKLFVFKDGLPKFKAKF